jgi:tetratricopeptide (TPR) repeat protein
LAWLTGLVNREQGYLEEAERSLRSVVEDITPEMRERGFDFSRDYEVINLLGLTIFDRAKQEFGDDRRESRLALLEAAVEQFQKTLQLDQENVTAHYNLQLLYRELGQEELAEQHQRLHERYKPDDNAADRAVALARSRYPAANHAAEALVIYPLRAGAAGETTELADQRAPE